jgi:hypothetical protein
MAKKNSTAFADVPLSPLTGQMDLRSPSGTVPIGDFRVVLNASMNELRKRCRRNGWRKFGFNSPQGFNNQDLHDQLFELDGSYCNDPTVESDPPSGSIVLAGTYVVLSSENEDAEIYYTTDGSDPTTASTNYTGPFQLPIGVTTVKAIGVDGVCQSDVFTFTYTYTDEILEFMEFHYLCNSDDKAGVFFEFEPNGQHNDYVWGLDFSTANGIDVKRIEIYETDTDGVWVTGQAWATDNPVYPAEMGGAPFAIYPLVIFEDDVQQNTEYLTTVLSGVAAGGHHWLLYGQPFVPNDGYFKLKWTVLVDDVEQTIYSLIPNDCDCGYYDDQCCYQDESCYYEESGLYRINVQFRQNGQDKVGMAAAGEVDDEWNGWDLVFDLENPQFLNQHDGTPTTAYISTQRSGNTALSIFSDIGTTASSDELMNEYYVLKWSEYAMQNQLRFIDLEAGNYDVYVYGHGDANNKTLKVSAHEEPAVDGPYEETNNSGNYLSPLWAEGDQYVKFNVTITAPGNDLVLVFANNSHDGKGYLNGIQLVRLS